MRNRLRLLLRKIDAWLTKRPDQSALVRRLTDELKEHMTRERLRDLRSHAVEASAELVEARQMAGAGPWLVSEARGAVDLRDPEAAATKIRESDPLGSTGGFRDLDLALQNYEWRREVNLSWIEFSRWGIQQLMLICRLYYIKNAIIRRLINISSFYVFGRGVEVSSPDEAANEILKEFFERNSKVLGQVALTDLERRKYYDGNLFFVFFADEQNTGRASVRTIDALEVQDIVTNPDDADEPWLYRRQWTTRRLDPIAGVTNTFNEQAWYPALNYNPAVKEMTINGVEVKWGNPILHRKCGTVSKWLFGCPLIYPALNWAKISKEFLENTATVRKALSQIAATLTTKGGQQAMEGAKQQLGTTVGTGSGGWDTNPTAVAGSIFASGPGTKLEAFHTRGAGTDPEEVRQYKLMACIVVGVPETFLADVSTGNLATATTLDRPTELCFLEKQEAWREDLAAIAKYVLHVSLQAPSGRLRESRGSVKPEEVTICEMARARGKDGRMYYVAAKTPPKPGRVEVKVNFPAIREGDIPQLVAATVQAMTLGGQTVSGIDAKEGVRKLYDLIGIENGEELVEEQFPEATYEPDRTLEPEPEEEPETPPIRGKEALTRAAQRLLSESVKEMQDVRR